MLISFLGTGPLIAAAFGRPRTTAILGALAIVLAVALGEFDSMFLSMGHLVRVGVVAVVSLLSVWLAAIREGLERARFRYGLIAAAGAVMTAALDYEVSLIGLARLCSQELADWCFVFIAEEDGSIRQLAAAHPDPERQKLAWDLLVHYPLDPGRSEGPAKAIRTGRPELLPVVTDDVLRAIAADDENLRLLRLLELRSAMIAPLVARGRILGAIAFASSESGRVFDAEDLRLAEELSTRAAISLDNARLYMRLSDAEKELRASHRQVQAILDGVADGVTAQDASGRLVYANDAAARQVGLASSDELLATDPVAIAMSYDMVDADGNDFPFDALPGRRALRGEQPEPALVRYRSHATGEERWSQIKATAIRGEDGKPLLAINVVEDVTEQREREERQRFLADAGVALAASLNVSRTFPQIAELVTGQLGDWCTIEVLEADGSARTIASAHANPDTEPLARELLSRYPLTSASYLRHARGGGQAQLIEEMDDVQIAALARDPEHLALLLQIRPRSSITVPLTVRGRLLGAISIVTAESGRRLDEDDLWLAEELAGRCALALDNARLYEERSRIARTLQESLLPPLLPELPGIDVAARFRAAGEGIEVGGDFYDLFEIGDAGWAVAIGDVCGKGTGAAAVTALARYTVRAAAMRQEGPSQILGLLNEALLRQRSDRRFCTVLYGQLARNGHGAMTFEFASGGHPLPLLLQSRNGAGAELGRPGTLLGIVPDPSLRNHKVGMEPGDAMALYTDGVTDAGAPQRIWSAAELAEQVGPTDGLRADEIAERMLQSVLAGAPGEPRDDIAIIVLKVPETA